MLTDHDDKKLNTITYCGCSGMGKQEFVYTPLKDLLIGWSEKTDSPSPLPADSARKMIWLRHL